MIFIASFTSSVKILLSKSRCFSQNSGKYSAIIHVKIRLIRLSQVRQYLYLSGVHTTKIHKKILRKLSRKFVSFFSFVSVGD